MQTTRFALIASALMVLLVLPTRVHGQDVLGLAINGGLTFAAGDEGDHFGAGPNFGFKTVVPLSERLAIQATVGYQELRVRQDQALTARGYDPSTFRLGGGFMEGGHRRSLGVLANAQFHVIPRSERLSPYVLVGGGVSQVRLTDFGIYFLGQWDDEPGSSEIAMTADAGAGIQLRVSRAVSFFGQATYETLFTEGGSTTMVPTLLGLMIELGP